VATPTADFTIMVAENIVKRRRHNYKSKNELMKYPFMPLYVGYSSKSLGRSYLSEKMEKLYHLDMAEIKV